MNPLRRAGFGLATAVLIAACGGSVLKGVPQAAPREAQSADTLWYASVRERVDGRASTNVSDSIEFGFVVTTPEIEGDTLTGPIVLTLVDSVRLTRAEFVEMIRQRLSGRGARDDGAVLSIHGFGTRFDEAWAQATNAYIRSGTRGPWIVFCWPSRGGGLRWPRDGRYLTRAYREDSAAAMASLSGFAASLGAVLDAAGAENTLLLAHSLGAMLVGEALATDTALRSRLGRAPLRVLAFAAPDIEQSRFVQVVRPAAAPLTRRMVVYGSRNDRTLAMSRIVNRSERAGLIDKRGVAGFDHREFELVDATDALAAEGWARRIVGSHHTMGRETGAYFDFFHIVGSGHPPECRAVLGTGTRSEDGIWRLSRTTRPPANDGRCGAR